jgi:predicted CoA-binding protein
MSSTFSVPENQLSTGALIQKFLALPRFALIGVSRNSNDFTRLLMREFLNRNYDVVPVNPAADADIEGRKAFTSIRDLTPPVFAALIVTSAEHTEEVVRDCAEGGVELIWMYRATGKGAVNEKAVEFCREREIEVIAGECPLMFLPKNGFHAIHGFIRKVTGTYPK